MANAGDIKIKLKAETKEFQAAMKRAERAADKFVDGVEGGLRRVKRAMKSILPSTKTLIKTLAAGLTAATVAIIKTSNSIDLLAKSASKLDIAVGSLQKLQFQAALTGVSSQQLNISLESMVRRVSEAKQGTGEAVKALASLGLNAARLNAMPTDKKFEAIAAALKKVKSSSSQAEIAYRIFGESGIKLVNTLRSDLAAAGKEFDSLGIKITDSQAKAVEGFNNSRLALGLMFKGILQLITIELAPALTKLADKIRDMFKSGEIQAFAKALSKKIVKGILKLKDNLPTIIAGFRTLGSVLSGVLTVMELMVSVADILISSFKSIGKGIKDAGMGAINDKVDIWRKANKGQTKTLRKSGAVPQKFIDLEARMNKKGDEQKSRGIGGWVDAFGSHVELFANATAAQTAVGKVLASRGKPNLNEILGGGVQQAKSDRFNEVARKLADSVESGTATKKSNEYFLNQLKTITHVAGIGKSAGATSGLLGAIKELQVFIKAKNTDKESTKIDVSVEFNDPMFSAKVERTTNALVAKETAKIGR